MSEKQYKSGLLFVLPPTSCYIFNLSRIKVRVYNALVKMYTAQMFELGCVRYCNKTSRKTRYTANWNGMCEECTCGLKVERESERTTPNVDLTSAKRYPAFSSTHSAAKFTSSSGVVWPQSNNSRVFLKWGYYGIPNK